MICGLAIGGARFVHFGLSFQGWACLSFSRRTDVCLFVLQVDVMLVGGADSTVVGSRTSMRARWVGWWLGGWCCGYGLGTWQLAACTIGAEVTCMIGSRRWRLPIGGFHWWENAYVR